MLIQQLQPGTGRRIQQKSAKAFCDNWLMEFITKSIVYFIIICKLCAIHPLYQQNV